MQNSTKIRHQAILEIIHNKRVYNQEELALLLKEAGISSTQATLSRDLNALGDIYSAEGQQFGGKTGGRAVVVQ